MVPNIGSFAAAAVHPSRVSPAGSTIAPKRAFAHTIGGSAPSPRAGL